MAVPVGVFSVRLEIDISLFTSTSRAIRFLLEISYDDGVTWRTLAGFTIPGGSFVDDDGAPLLTAYLETGFPDTLNTKRKVRGTVTITGGIFRTTGGVLIVKS